MIIIDPFDTAKRRSRGGGVPHWEVILHCQYRLCIPPSSSPWSMIVIIIIITVDLLLLVGESRVCQQPLFLESVSVAVGEASRSRCSLCSIGTHSSWFPVLT
ncbi:hypothetical protein LZ31DRAFT_102948 [Colletotrichum somersetense]|nr:hypothetical protein LZ31DRAFT_102948 [Colletotrichum somersetense]